MTCACASKAYFSSFILICTTPKDCVQLVDICDSFGWACPSQEEVSLLLCIVIGPPGCMKLGVVATQGDRGLAISEVCYVIAGDIKCTLLKFSREARDLCTLTSMREN